MSFSESTRDRPRLEGEPETCESHGELLFAWLSRGGSNGLGGEREGVLWRGEALGMVLTREVNPALLPSRECDELAQGVKQNREGAVFATCKIQNRIFVEETPRGGQACRRKELVASKIWRR